MIGIHADEIALLCNPQYMSDIVLRFLFPDQAGNDIPIPLARLFERVEVLLRGRGYENFFGRLLTGF